MIRDNYYCGWCGADVEVSGYLANLAWAQCKNCGMWTPVDIIEDEDDEDEEDYE